MGFTLCELRNTARECERHTLYFQRPYMDAPGTTVAREQNVVMHEMGHGLGLNHVFGAPLDLMAPSVSDVGSFNGTHIRLIDRYYRNQ